MKKGGFSAEEQDDGEVYVKGEEVCGTRGRLLRIDVLLTGFTGLNVPCSSI